MSAPDPAAALRAFVIEQKKVGKYRDPSRYVTMDYTRAAPALLAHVERLEAERDRLREALREMVGRDVDTCIAAECRDVPRLRRAEWCSSCIAREALGEAKP